MQRTEETINKHIMKTITKSLIPLSSMAINTIALARKIQEESLKVRKELFYDQELGFDHNMGGVRTDASIEYATRRINAITDGFITFHFVSHRRLWFEFEGVDKRYTLHCANEYDFNTKESIATNPYNEIAVEVIKALKERDEMEKMYQRLIAA
jgi:hypothetical protein